MADKTQKTYQATFSKSIMAKKFKINDQQKDPRFVETATLLEPANNSASNQSEAEEIREVSFQLAAIKKKHDEEKKKGNEKQEELEKIRKEIDQCYVQEVEAEGPSEDMRNQLLDLADSIEDTKYKTQEEEFTKSTYIHMLDRMKKDFIASKIQSSDYGASLKNKSSILELEQQKQRKIKQERLQSKSIFQHVLDSISKEQQDRSERIRELQKCITNKEESVQRRIQRQRKNQEIAEAAANENKDQSELKMRDNLHIQNLWDKFMKKKMDNEMRNSAPIDEAFKAINTATGCKDVQDLVRRFLTREQQYGQLLANVAESDRKIDNLKKENDYLRERLHDLRIESQAVEDDGHSDAEAKFQDQDIIEMRTNISSQQKEYQLLQEKYKKINIVNDQISGWAKRCYGKFSALTDDNTLQNVPDDIVKVFAAMEMITVGELKSLKERADDNPVEPDDAFIDFATEDFINKNIRVRPISGVTNKDETRDGRQSNVSRGQAGDENGEAPDNSDNMAKYEMENQRKLAKKKYNDYQDELKRKQALEDKKAQKK